jgi:hypothetical protein
MDNSDSERRAYQQVEQVLGRLHSLLAKKRQAVLGKAGAHLAAQLGQARTAF